VFVVETYFEFRNPDGQTDLPLYLSFTEAW
jgi:hypothetical protein